MLFVLMGLIIGFVYSDYCETDENDSIKLNAELTKK
jgi:hypothetical protein